MRAGRALLATLVLALALVLPALTGLPGATAQEPAALVTVTLDSFTPSLPQRNSEITVTGRVRNVSRKPILRPRAYLWRNQAPIVDQEGFDQALGSLSNEPLGARKIASYHDLYPSADSPYLAPGATAAFALKVKVADLDLSPTPGVYLMGVHVLENDLAPAIGRARILVPVVSASPRNTLQMTAVVALNSQPSLVCGSCGPSHQAVFLDHHLADEIASGGRLDALLSAAEQVNASFAVDPALVEEVSAMSKGYQIKGNGGGVETGPGQTQAARWLQRFTRLLRGHDGYRLLYGSADIAALTHAGQQNVVQAAVRAGQRVPLTASLPLLVWPGFGLADAPTLAAADALHPKAVLLSDVSTQAGAPLLKAVGGAPIVNYTAAAFAGGPGPQPSDDQVHLQQRLLGESWIQAETAPAGTTLGRVRLINTAAQAAGDGEAIKAPWVKQTTLTQLLSSTPRTWPKLLHYPASSRQRELNGSQLGAIAQLSQSWATWQDLLVDPANTRATADAALARAASVQRRQDTVGLYAYLKPQQDELDQRLDAVQISVTRRVLTPKSKVFFPVTILNTLPPSTNPADSSANAVRVRVDFASANRQRLNVQPIPLATIQAGQNLPGRAVVEARTNGTVQVTAQLYTASGLPVGKPKIIDVQATQAGTVGWLIAIGAGIVLVGTTALRIRQVTRERARAAAAEPSSSSGAAVADTDLATSDEMPSEALSSAPARDTAPPDPASIDV